MIKKNTWQQPFERSIDGKTMRNCRKYNIRVNREGTYVYREYKDPNLNGPLIIHMKSDGFKYLKTKSHGEIPLDEVVATCFNSMPKDGKKYTLIHKDSDLRNCSSFNLEWKQVSRFLATGTTRKLDNGLKVRNDGTIFDKKEKLSVVSGISDADTGRSFVAVNPYVRYDRRNRYKEMVERHSYIDDLMAKAEFVEGDATSLLKPKVLHKDLDYMNFKSSNLQWVEEDSREYQDYITKKMEDMDQLTVKKNPGHSNPLMKF